jgi:hypothetical protein
MPQELRSDILAFYGGPGLANSTKTDADDSARVVKELDQLRAVDLDLAPNGSHEVASGGPRNTEVSAEVRSSSPMSRFNLEFETRQARSLVAAGARAGGDFRGLRPGCRATKH